jgi:FMN phosphatase YigB (HAD superfamily)
VGTYRATEQLDTSLLDRTWELVTFDVFDTLLVRDTVLPKSAAIIVKQEDKFRTPLGWRFGIEHALRIYSGIFGNVRETNFKIMSKFLLGNFISKEKLFEKQILKARPLGLDLLQKASRQSNQIAYISDTCYSSIEIRKFLVDAGVPIHGPIFVSNELRATKREGGAYLRVGNLLGVDFSSWLHIGDDGIADNVSAKVSGIKTILLSKQVDILNDLIHPRHFDFLTRGHQIDALLSLGIFANQSELNAKFRENYFYRLGFTTIGPLVCGFAEWISQQSQADQKIAFLGRDGFIPKQIFDLFNEKSQNSMYARVSRRKLLVPAWLAFGNGASNFLRRMPKRANETVMEYLKRLGIRSDGLLVGSTESKQLDKVLGSNNVREQASLELIQLKDLLESVAEVDFVVDVGWRATLQEALQILGSRIVKGLYLGTSSTTFIKKPRAKGWLTNAGRPHKYGKVLRQSIGFIERSLSEQVASDLGSNTSQVGFEFDSRISSVQQGALDFARLWMVKSKEYNVHISREMGISGLKAVMLFPESIDLEGIGSLGHQHDPSVGSIDQTSLIPIFPTSLSTLKGFPNATAAKANWSVGYEKQVVNALKLSGKTPGYCSLILWRVGPWRDIVNFRNFQTLAFSVYMRWVRQLRSNSSSQI